MQDSGAEMTDGELDGEALTTANNNGVKRTNPAQFNLEFVSMNVGSQAEKERNQKVVRSTAMRSFRRLQQSQRLQETRGSSRESRDGANNYKRHKTKSKKGSYSDVRDQSAALSRNSSSEATFADILRLANASPSSNNESGGFRLAGSSRSGPLTNSRSQSPSIVSSPFSLVGAGRIDPFRSHPVDTRSYIPELIDHCTTVLWPGFRPRGSSGAGSKISAAWLEKVYERPVVMHALLFGATVHLDVLRSPRSSLHNPVRLFHKVQTMGLLKEELKSHKTPLDEVILAVLSLGTNEVETMLNGRKEKIRSPFNSPLTSTQWLDVYGSISHIPAHTTAMRSLVGRRGGLENIELEGLAEVLSFSDILGATQDLSKPYWPLLDPSIKFTDESLNFLPRKLGQGLEDLLDFGINENMASVLQAMADLTTTIDCHCRGIRPILDLTILIDRRNAVQHRLLSLPKGDELGHEEVSSLCLYDSMRHTAIIYSVAVTFPLPPLTGIFRKLATLLKNIIEGSKFDPCWQLCPQILLWMLVLGGIAASNTAERSWYVQNLAAISGSLNLREWEEVTGELENYLWLESACDTGGRLLWTEVIHGRLLQHCEEMVISDF